MSIKALNAVMFTVNNVEIIFIKLGNQIPADILDDVCIFN